MQFPFGQPIGGLVQCAYTVADLEAGMAAFTQNLGAGPWFVTGPFIAPEGRYRGEPTRLHVTLAIAFAGHIMIELVQQHDDGPSVYREMFATRGHGFHHWAVGSKDFDADVARYEARGYPVAFSDRSPRGNRVIYVDATRDLPGMIEIIEMIPSLDERYTMMHQASIGWDGRDPVRR